MRVPDFTPDLVNPSVAQPVHADAGAGNLGLAALHGQQMQQYGRDMQGIGEAGMKIASDMSDQINQTMVTQATNSMQEKVRDLTFGTIQNSPSDPPAVPGYTSIKGQAAFQTPDGQKRDLPGEFMAKLNDAQGQIANTLQNDAQRNAFAARSGDIANAFSNNLASHQQAEFKNYTMTGYDGDFKNASSDAIANWSDPVQADSAVMRAMTAVANASRFSGDAPSETVSKVNAASSATHSKIIDAAIQAGNTTYAIKWLQDHKDGIVLDPNDPNSGRIGNMTGDDILRINGVLQKDIETRQALAAVGQTTQTTNTLFAPSDTDRLASIVSNLESGGQQFNKDGSTVIGYNKVAIPTPPAGKTLAGMDDDGDPVWKDAAGVLTDKDGDPVPGDAKLTPPPTAPQNVEGGIGIMQVTKTTGPEAAKLAGLPWDENRLRTDPAYNAALGKAYLQSKIQTWGNTAQALAAGRHRPGNSGRTSRELGILPDAYPAAVCGQGRGAVQCRTGGARSPDHHAVRQRCPVPPAGECQPIPGHRKT